MKIDIMSCDSTSLVTLKSLAIFSSAGAIIEEATGVMNVKVDTDKAAAHLFLVGQFLGFSGSSGPFQVTLAN